MGLSSSSAPETQLNWQLKQIADVIYYIQQGRAPAPTRRAPCLCRLAIQARKQLAIGHEKPVAEAEENWPP